MRIILTCLLLITTMFISCGKTTHNNKELIEKIQDEEVAEAVNDFDVEEDVTTEDVQEVADEYAEDDYFKGKILKNVIGFVIIDMDDSDFDKGEMVTILNSDNSKWLEIKAENLQDISDSSPENFKPWLVLFEGYHKIIFRCISEDEDYYHIAVNDNETIIKRLKKGNNTRFETIEEHLQTVLVDSDNETNPMRTNAGTGNPAAIFSKEVLAEGVDAYNAIDIAGEWMKIRDIGNENIVGWVRWKDGDILLIRIWYLM